MVYLATYCVLMALAFAWIAVDYETGYVFDVFGKNFHWVWYEYPKRWTTVLTYGWRLLLLIGFEITHVLLAYLVLRDNPLGAPYWAQVVLHIGMILAALALVPWIGKAHQMRRWRALRRTARALAHSIQRIAENRDTSGLLPATEYSISHPWTAWYPDDKEWVQWKGRKPFLFRPMIYLVAGESVLAMVSGSEFLSWNAQDGFPEIGTPLPFTHGEVKYEVTSV